jgi:hypothetical protein
VLENGEVNIKSGTFINNIITITCNDGYYISGDSTWTCADSGWDATATCVIQGLDVCDIYAVIFKPYYCLLYILPR